MTRDERALRAIIVAKARWMNAAGLNQGTSGNISARYKDVLLITPSATPYDSMTPESVVAMPLNGEYGAWSGPLKPSTEWRFHFDITKARPDVGAIVHTHSTYATVLAIARKEIPACHYMIAAFGGTNVRCAGYARYGTKELSDFALQALEGRNGCLLANHGTIALAPTWKKPCGSRSNLRRSRSNITYRSRSAIQPFCQMSRSPKPRAGSRATAFRIRRRPPRAQRRRADRGPRGVFPSTPRRLNLMPKACQRPAGAREAGQFRNDRPSRSTLETPCRISSPVRIRQLGFVSRSPETKTVSQLSA